MSSLFVPVSVNPHEAPLVPADLPYALMCTTNTAARMNVATLSTTSTTSTTTPPAPMNADYYDDINIHLTKIDVPSMMSLSIPKMDKGSMVFVKPPQPKPLWPPLPQLKPLSPVISAPPKGFSASLLRDVRPLPLEKHAKTFPTFFDIFKPAPFPTLPPMKNFFSVKNSDTPFGYVPRLQSPVSRKSIFKFRTSPPVSWTYCEPICGSGDQAVDAESALDNAQVDIKEGLAQAFSVLHLPPMRDDQYKAKSTILEELGKGYDYSGYQYVTIGDSVAFKRHKNDTSKNSAFYVDVKVEVQHNNTNSAVLKQVANKLFSFLQLSKGARLPEAIEVVSE